MDDRELERLFGNESDSDKETLGKEDKAAEGRSEKKDTGSGRHEKHRPEKNTPAKKESGKKAPDKKEAGEKGPEKKDSDKKTPEKKEPVKKESDKKDPEKGDSVKENPEKEITGKEAPEDKPSEDKEDGKETEKNGEKEPSPDEASGDEKDKAEEGSGEGSGEDNPEDIKEDSDEAGEDAGDKEKTPEKEEKGDRKAAVHEDVRKRRARPEPEPSGIGGIKNIAEMIPLSGKSILAICLAFAVVLMVVLVMFLPAFRVRNTSVEGNVVLTDQEILKAVGLEYDAHLMSGVSGNIIDILRLDYGKTEQRIKEENPYIEDIRITIKLPSTVDIKVRERSKVCYIRTPDGYAALDRDGIVLELSSFDSGRTVRPVICGLNVKYAEMGKPVKIENMNDYKKSIIVLGAILAADNASVGGDYSMFENTSEVRILPSGYIFLTIYSPSGNLIQIKLNGTESIGDKMAWLLYVFNGEAFDKITVDGALDMTGEEYIFGEYD